MTKETMEKILATLDRIETKLECLEKLRIKKSQEEHGCAVNEHWDEERQQCVPDFPCEENFHWDEEKQKCVPDNPFKNESAKGEGLTHALNYGASEELQKQWEREDKERELSEKFRVNTTRETRT